LDHGWRAQGKGSGEREPRIVEGLAEGKGEIDSSLRSRMKKAPGLKPE